MEQTETDKRFMDAAIRLARRHEGLTGTNPSVACIIVRFEDEGPHIVGSAITAKGGRPHAEPLALQQAGKLANSATAYVTLEPCAHHGKTPPCARTLIDAGIERVVTAIIDPDDRVNEKGHEMLGNAGIKLMDGINKNDAAIGLSSYLIQRTKSRAQVTLKQAISQDGYIGTSGHGILPITSSIARAQSHMLRARHHAILIGVGTVIEDNPDLTVRLPGLKQRSPVRIVLDPTGRIPIASNLVANAQQQRTIIVLGQAATPKKRQALTSAGCQVLPCDVEDNGAFALPELLEDLAAIGIHSLLVEGGAKTASAFLEDDLVDCIILFKGAGKIKMEKGKMISSPLANSMPQGFVEAQSLTLGDDHMVTYRRKTEDEDQAE